jgi:hypothetical protein
MKKNKNIKCSIMKNIHPDYTTMSLRGVKKNDLSRIEDEVRKNNHFTYDKITSHNEVCKIYLERYNPQELERINREAEDAFWERKCPGLSHDEIDLVIAISEEQGLPLDEVVSIYKKEKDNLRELQEEKKKREKLVSTRTAVRNFLLDETGLDAAIYDLQSNGSRYIPSKVKELNFRTCPFGATY